ncbi:triacylglycerol lipase 1-like isoform X1 [Olea europaea subsp. europaea]|uniref:Triacylglycerol lipase 1-like isoform X1 n=1 Tax=Olea europaea subsp. europaea TaxID=158383 RepID=A0A8S0Q4P7_OLEEU|nr:triacylglycerol lipase 1-like isoform X1 [Olea europaea subsp. europaea]
MELLAAQAAAMMFLLTGLCAQLIKPSGFPCSEHKTQTKDGFVQGLQRVSSSSGNLRRQRGPPVLLIRGLFMAGDAWFLDNPNQSLGFILANRGFDVWVVSGSQVNEEEK